MAGERRVRLNYLAILVSALVYFAVQAIWFTIFMRQWLVGIGRTMDELMQLQQQGHSPVVAYCVAFLGALILATSISWFTQMTGAQTIFRGVWIAALLWFGFVLTTWSAEYAFEARSIQTLGINTCATLIGMVLMGAILGGWKAKSKTLTI